MNSDYNLEIDRIVELINEKGYKKICLQLPDGLKPRAQEIVDTLFEKTTAQVLIWAGSNFGACDIPLEVERLGVDALIHFGHSEWK